MSTQNGDKKHKTAGGSTEAKRRRNTDDWTKNKNKNTDKGWNNGKGASVYDDDLPF